VAELRSVIRSEHVTLHAPPAQLYGSAKAFYFPEMVTTSLTAEVVHLNPTGAFRRAPTLVGCTGSRFSEAMVDGWLNGLAGQVDADGTPPVQTLWLSLVEGLTLRMLQRPLLSSMRWSVPVERHASFLCHFGDSQPEREQLHMSNRYIGYVCLVDEQGVVRWHVHSSEAPTEDALAALRDLLR